ncbi:hypothetical protein METEAL_35270 [Mesoterricola silvestris]|uniref:Uncharacterized protein n=1 Tax=Mesoterricola silvestris TaxID=2927979 RepID=A0AA48H1L6_9BACT|nr:hypothetical protein METEAL_35270 [Mesoterricola silvestris]
MLLLCIQCLSAVGYRHYPYGFPDLTASAVVLAVHSRFRNSLVSIALGTLVYGLMVQWSPFGHCIQNIPKEHDQSTGMVARSCSPGVRFQPFIHQRSHHF